MSGTLPARLECAHGAAAFHAQMLVSSCLRVALALGLASCAVSGDSYSSGHDALARSAPPALGLHCTLSFRASNELGPGDTGEEPAFQFATRPLDVGANERGEVGLGAVTLAASHEDASGEDASYHVRVYGDGVLLHHARYVFDRAAPPRYEFAGYHGLSGLVYVAAPDGRGDYQYVCGAAPAKALPTADGTVDDADVEAYFRREDAASSVRLRCELTRRARAARGVAGELTRRVFELRPNAGQEVTLGAITLGASYSESREEGAAFSVGVSRGGRALHRALYQFARSNPPKHRFRDDTGFTGRVHVNVPDDPSVYTYTCGIP